MAASDRGDCYEGGAVFLLFLDGPVQEMAILQGLDLQGAYVHRQGLDGGSCG